MGRVKYDTDLIKAMALFERFTGTKLKDCIVGRNSEFIFIVEPHEAGKAIGKGGKRLRKLQELIKRKIKIVEFDPEVTRFVRNLIYPLEVKSIRKEGRAVVIEGTNRQNRAMLIGKGRQNLDQYESVVKRHFDITELKVA